MRALDFSASLSRNLGLPKRLGFGMRTEVGFITTTLNDSPANRPNVVFWFSVKWEGSVLPLV